MMTTSASVIVQVERRDRTRRVTAYATAALAVLSLVSAASRPFRSRLIDLLTIVPIEVPKTAAVLLVFISFALFATARQLRRGSRLGWGLALLLLIVMALLHLTRGLDVPMAVLTGGCGVWLATQHSAFPVLPARAVVHRTLVAGLLGAVLAGAVSMVMVTHVARTQHRTLKAGAHAIAHDLGTHHRLPIDYDGPFAILVIVATLISLVAIIAWFVYSARRSGAIVGNSHQVERERARQIVAEYGGGTLDYFALRDDKQWLFIRRSCVAYAVRGGVCLVSPDPIGPSAEREEIWAEFMLFAEREGWSVSVLGAGQDWVNTYEATGLRCLYVGDEAVVDCPNFSLSGKKMKSLRHSHSRVHNAGYTTTHVDPLLMADSDRQALLELSTLSRRGEVERGFSMTLSRLFDPADTGLLISIARDAAGAPQAFIQWTPAADIAGWSLDVMRRNTSADLPNGVIDYLIVETINHVAATGGQGQGLGLNFAVMRNVVADQDEASRVSQFVIRQLSQRTQMESLWRFNSKFSPRWVPRFVALGSADLWLGQGLMMARAEGLTEVPIVGKLLKRGQ